MARCKAAAKVATTRDFLAQAGRTNRGYYSNTPHGTHDAHPPLGLSTLRVCCYFEFHLKQAGEPEAVASCGRLRTPCALLLGRLELTQHTFQALRSDRCSCRPRSLLQSTLLITEKTQCRYCHTPSGHQVMPMMVDQHKCVRTRPFSCSLLCCALFPASSQSASGMSVDRAVHFKQGPELLTPCYKGQQVVC
jgi:hypothetical protein